MTSMRKSERKPLLTIAEARANRASRGVRRSRPRRRSRAREVVEPSLETLRDYIDWQFFFHAWELKGKFPAILEQPGGARALRRRAGAARRDRRDRLLTARGVSASGRRRRRRRHRARDDEDALLLPAPAGRLRRLAAEPLASRTTSRPRGDTSARSRSPRASAPTSSPPGSRPSTTTTARSWRRLLPTASPRRSPSTCTSGRAATGLRGGTSSSRART